MTFSVITASFNSEKTLKATMESVLTQSYKNIEFIIVDGNSSDSTLDIIKSFEDEFGKKSISYKWISEKDSGIYDAWNKGVKLATGDWISFLGSDDYYLSNAIEDYYKAICTNKEVDYDIVYSNIKLVDGEKIIKIIEGTWSWKQFRRFMSFPHVGAFHNKKYFEKHGLFDTSYEITGDYELLLRAKKNLKTLKINKQTVIMAVGGISNSQISKVFKETFKAKNKTGGLNKIVCSFDYIMSFVKYVIRKTIYALS